MIDNDLALTAVGFAPGILFPPPKKRSRTVAKIAYGRVKGLRIVGLFPACREKNFDSNRGSTETCRYKTAIEQAHIERRSTAVHVHASFSRSFSRHYR
ncbi:hypothetical protein ACQZ48_09465 [Agrobacterium sp. 22-209-1]|uniref:hypothetical protein n=1 Tax=Agrobacterium salinitolerans TaxID=1183413 RepID=UPI00196AAB04|nr:hypothetical protein [Agrobacterium salinitolerans]